MAENTDPSKDSSLESPIESTAASPATTGMEPLPQTEQLPSEVTAVPVPPSGDSTPVTASENPQPGTSEVEQVSPPAEPQLVETPVSLEEYQGLQKQKDELFERFLRKQAEFENFRKRVEREKQEFLDYALFQFVRDLLPVLDSLERALHAPDGESVEDHKKGIELVLKQLRDLLSSAGLQPIRSLGRLFDPHYHQAMLREESDRYTDNEVIEEFQRGYIFKDRLLRPAMVRVAVAPLPGLPSEKPVETEAH